MFLERWTVDQIVDDAVGVDRARFHGQVDAKRASDLVARACEAELEDFSHELWAAEVVAVFDRREFIRQLAIRAAEAAGRVAEALKEADDPRPLFEGQVLWMLTAAELPETREGHQIGPADTRWFFEGMAAPDPASHGPMGVTRIAAAGIADSEPAGAGTIIDVTQAAKAAMKRQYQQALEAPPN